MWDILDNAICFNVSVFETHKLGFQDMKASPIILPLMKPLSPMHRTMAMVHYTFSV